VDRLKPHVVRTLANAELYCLALSNLYSDPNFHNLNHCGIIQALARLETIAKRDLIFFLFNQIVFRKGILVAEPPDCALTETMLIQTNPLKMVSATYLYENIKNLDGIKRGEEMKRQKIRPMRC